jgi:ferrous iron transport protein B
VADLPGLYSLESVVDPATDEGNARRVVDAAIAAGRRLLIVQVVDLTQLALGLRLTRELVRRGVPLLVVGTQRDLLEAEGRTFDAAALERAIGAPVVAVSARDRRVRERLLDAIAARLRTAVPAETATATVFEPDAVARHVIGDAPHVSEEARRRRTLTARVDAWLLHPVVGPILFLGLMASVFAAVFLVADPVTSFLDTVLDVVGARVGRALGGGVLASFVIDGLLGGAGTVLAFMPQIVILTVAMELLEASGYLARGAFLVDRLLRLLGLSGRSFLPLLMGHACAVPAVSSTRIIRDPRERLTTILVLPLMTCSARIPTYALLLGTFFATRGAFFKASVFVGLYFAGILSGLVASLVLRRTATSGRSLPLVLEMPAYRAPEPRVIARKAARTSWRFLRDVGTTIVGVSAVLWVLLTVPLPGAGGGAPASATAAKSGVPARTLVMEKSVAAGIGKALEPVTRPVGFDWRINVGLIGSFGAREVMVSTMGVIFGLEDAGDDPAPLSQRMRGAYSLRTGLALLAFFVFACQCMSTLAAIRRETKTWKWPAVVLGYTYAVAYAAAFGVYQIAGWLGA